MRSRAFRPVGWKARPRLRLRYGPIYGARAPLAPLSLNPIEGFLKNFEVAGVANLFARLLDPFFLQRIFRGTIGFVKHPEHAGEWNRGKFIRGDLVSDIVTEFILRCVVPLLLLYHFEAAAFARIGRIEYVREKFDAFTQTFDDAKALVIERAFDYLHPLNHVRGVRAGDEGGSACDQFFHRVNGLIDGACGIGFRFESDRRGRRSLFLRQSVDEVVHDEIRQVDVLTGAVIEMIAADGESVAVAAEQEHVEIGPGETDAARKRHCAAVNEVRAVAVDEIRKTR